MPDNHRRSPPPPHLCFTVDCMASSLQFLLHCLSVFLFLHSNQLIRSHPPSPIPPPFLLLRQCLIQPRDFQCDFLEKLSAAFGHNISSTCMKINFPLALQGP